MLGTEQTDTLLDEISTEVTIKGTEYCTVDVLEPLLPKIKELGFSYVRSHSKGTPPDKNVIHMYCSDVLRTLTCKKINRILITIPNEVIDVAVLDGSFGYSQTYAGDVSTANDHMNILYSYGGNKYIVGYYDAENNNVYLSDITHKGTTDNDAEAIEFARILLAEILVVIEEFNKKRVASR